jgi:hypothetical protein
MYRIIVPLLLLLALGSVRADAQAYGSAPVGPVKLSGPRFGLTYLPETIREKARDEFELDFDLNPIITQFGWQFETRFLSSESGFAGVTEWVVLVGGLEQGAFIPSISWLVGARTLDGMEFGVGPNVSPAGSALAFAAGITMSRGEVNFPINLGVVPGRDGTRVSLLAGFNSHRR